MSDDAPPLDQQATRRRRAFLVWATVLTALWVFACLPRAPLGSLYSFYVLAGLPWPFAHWEGDRLEWFRPLARAADVGVWVGLMLLAWLCAWSREKRHRQDLSGKSL